MNEVSMHDRSSTWRGALNRPTPGGFLRYPLGCDGAALTVDGWARMEVAPTFRATYDAWDGLVRLTEPEASAPGVPVQDNSHDARGYRIITNKSYTAGTLTETRHAYFTDQWQCLEERLGTSTTPDRQFVWGLRYIDDLILRDRSLSGGTLNERLYALQDANWNVTTLTDSTGTIQERYEFDPYGATTVLAPDFTVRTSSNFTWEATYCGYIWDAASGLFAVRNRFNHPRLGAWLTRDPLRYRFGLNLYEYSDGNPPLHTDPLGLVSLVCGRLAHEIISAQVLLFNMSRFDNVFLDTAIVTISRTVGNCGTSSLTRPDILMVTVSPATKSKPQCCKASTGPLYEIKPDTPYGIATGPAQVASYVAILATGGVVAVPGHADPGTTGGYPTNPAFRIPACGTLGWVSRGSGMIYYRWYSEPEIKVRKKEQERKEKCYVGHAGDKIDVGLKVGQKVAVGTAVVAGSAALTLTVVGAPAGAAGLSTVGGLEAGGFATASTVAAASTTTQVAPVLAAGVVVAVGVQP